MMQRTININATPFWLGDKFYVVEKSKDRDNGMVFSTKCPSCDDTKKIRYIGANGKEFETKCPYCETHVYSRKTGDDTWLSITNWKVSEYIVNSVKLKTSEAMSAYKKGEIPESNVTEMHAFTRYGRSYDDIDTRHVPTIGDGLVDPDIEKDRMLWRPDEYVFTKKKDAEAFCKKVREQERHMLRHFNEKWGTDYRYPWEV